MLPASGEAAPSPDTHSRKKGRLGIANARLAYQQYKAAFAGDRWQRLAARGATKQRCLWASTSTLGWETISTMPEETIRAFQDHGHVEPRLESNVDEAMWLLAALAGAGVDYDDVVALLEREGVRKFTDSFSELLARLAAKRHILRAPTVGRR